METKTQLFTVTDEQGTPIRSMEGRAEVAYLYQGDVDFTTVLDEPIEKGTVRAEEGRFPDAAPGKIITRTEIKVTPSNYTFYQSRTAIKQTEDPKSVLDGKDEDKFKLQGTKPRTIKERKEAKDNATVSKLSKLTAAE